MRNILSSFWRLSRNLFYLLAVVALGFLIYRQFVPMEADLRKLTIPDIGEFICISDKSIQVGERIHYQGRVFVITKVVLQNSKQWVVYNRDHYKENPGPRRENAMKIELEVLPPARTGLQLFYAYYGLTAD